MALFHYHHNTSVCAAKVRVSLAEKGIGWEGRLMRLDGDQLEPAYVKLNPNSVVPTLIHEGRPVIESNVILEYLEDAFPSPVLRPAAAHDRAQARLQLMQLDEDTSGIHFAASVATYAIGRRHDLIARAGSADRDRLDRALRESMNPKSRELAAGCGVSRDRLAGISHRASAAAKDGVGIRDAALCVGLARRRQVFIRRCGLHAIICFGSNCCRWIGFGPAGPQSANGTGGPRRATVLPPSPIGTIRKTSIC